MSVVVRMNKRYVDDINLAVQATPPGKRYENGQIYVDERSVTEDGRVSSDERTMVLIKQVGNDIHPSIQLEVDYPSKHQDGKLPILDLKVWVESRKKKREGQVGKVSVITYEFQSKCMAAKAVINARPALSWSTKRTVLTQAVLRVLMNRSKLLPWERVVENVNEMVLRMQYSGYSRKFRYEVVDSALKALKQGMKLIKKENDRYIDPKSGGKTNENKKR